MKQHGFTLIELLVVMVLLGLVAGIAVTTLGGSSQGRELANEVNRLHAVLRMASEEAIFSNQEIGVVVESDLYEFLVYDEENRKWGSATQAFLKSHTLPEWVAIDFQREGKEREILGGTGDTLAESEFAGLSQEGEEASSKKPDFMLLSSGEVTGFVIGMEINNDGDSRLEIKTNEQGEIILPHLEQDDAS